MNIPFNLDVAMTILSVDDDIEDQEIFTEALTLIDPRIKCLRAHDGIEGHELLFDHKTDLCLDYIFLDINMPKMSGIELLLLIRKDKRLDNIPVYMLSTSCRPSDIEKISLLGATLLQKQNQFKTNVKMLSSIIRPMV